MSAFIRAIRPYHTAVLLRDAHAGRLAIAFPSNETLPFVPVYPGVRTSIFGSGSGSANQIRRKLA